MSENKKTGTRKASPPRRAKQWTVRLAGQAGRLGIIFLAAVIIGLMFSGLQVIGIPWLAALLNALILSGLLLLFFNEGLSAGVRDTEMSRRCEKLEKKVKHLQSRRKGPVTARSGLWLRRLLSLLFPS